MLKGNQTHWKENVGKKSSKSKRLNPALQLSSLPTKPEHKPIAAKTTFPLPQGAKLREKVPRLAKNVPVLRHPQPPLPLPHRVKLNQEQPQRKCLAQP
jgi:hypothetical protein